MYLRDQFQEYSSLWPLRKNTKDFYLKNMSDKIKVHGIFSNDDELCPFKDQELYWGRMPDRSKGEIVKIDGISGKEKKNKDDEIVYKDGKKVFMSEHGDAIGR